MVYNADIYLLPYDLRISNTEFDRFPISGCIQCSCNTNILCVTYYFPDPDPISL